jgi:hypothetical protein
MEIRKAQWVSSADKLHLAMPFSKINEEKRLVYGFASLDNADEHDDIVTAEASAEAFASFRGNIREMHQPIAAGRMIDFKQDTFIHDGQPYNGVFVTVYVSKGAESTWQKVLDGTLSGFSIGGDILDADTEFNKDMGKSIRFIKKYELHELSLVDNPANQLANVFSVEKLNDGTRVVKGLSVDTRIENVFYCKTDEIAKNSTEETLDCPACGESMENAGWIESDGANTEGEIAGIVEKYLSKQAEPANNEGGVDVADKNEELPEAGSAVPAGETDAVEQGEAETEANSSVEETEAEAADVSEVDDTENSLEKMLDDLKGSLSSDLEKTAESVNKAIGEIQETFTKSLGEFEAKISSLDERYTELSDRVSDLKNQVGVVEKSVSGIEKATAIKKSGDLGGSTEEETVEKSKTSLWGGAFLSNTLQ